VAEIIESNRHENKRLRPSREGEVYNPLRRAGHATEQGLATADRWYLADALWRFKFARASLCQDERPCQQQGEIVSIGCKRIGFLVATVILSFEISGQDLKYGNPSYQEKMDELAKEANPPGNAWNRYHESLAQDLCADNIKDVDKPGGKLAKRALDGDQEAVKQVMAFPDYC
jgi:hypothetical protein